MTSPISIQQQRASLVEPIVDRLVERAVEIPELTISHLVEEILNLLGQSIIATDEEAKPLLENRLRQIHHRNGLEPFGRKEQEFYHYIQNLINREGRINHFCLSQLRDVDLGERVGTDEEFDAYRIAVRRKNAFERELQVMRQDIDSLNQRLTRYMTMTPLSDIQIPSTNGTHKIPGQIPHHATHVLLYCKSATGANGGYADYEVILSNSLGHRHRFYYKSYTPQNAWSYNSENIWIQICPLKEITVQGGDPRFSINLIGYK